MNVYFILEGKTLHWTSMESVPSVGDRVDYFGTKYRVTEREWDICSNRVDLTIVPYRQMGKVLT